MADKLRYIANMIHIINASVDCNQWIKRLDNQVNDRTNQNFIKVPKVVKPTNKKTLLYNLGDYWINQLPVIYSVIIKQRVWIIQGYRSRTMDLKLIKLPICLR